MNNTNLISSKGFTDKYYKILSKDFPDFLYDYINTPEMQRLAKTSISCGCNYTRIFNLKFFYSNLDHSIAVALIIWNFTHDKKQTLAGLFHDIATPAFKHCIDFLNGDYEVQESTEEMTEIIIRNSPAIMRLLERDNISVSSIVDYKIYPIADNASPRLSADRLEYNLANGYFWHHVWNIDEIEVFYKDLGIGINEDGNPELAFKSLDIACNFLSKASLVWPTLIDNKDKIVMQFIADSVAFLINNNLIQYNDLYFLSEEEIINIILESDIKDVFLDFMNSTEWFESQNFVENYYCRSVKSKKRYLNPLVLNGSFFNRISDLSDISEEIISNYLKLDWKEFAYIKVKNF